MKNAGLAGAIALCGIGLIMIGIGNFVSTPRAMAAAPAAGQGPNHIVPSLESIGNGCEEFEEEVWFDPTTLRYMCNVANTDFANLLTTMVNKPGFEDINGDGRGDQFNNFTRTWRFQDGWNSEEFGALTFRSIGDQPVYGFQNIAIEWDEFLPSDAQQNEVVYVYGVVPADIDGDGRKDALFVRERSSTNGYELLWLRNITEPHPLADLNSDGQVNGIDLAFVLQGWTG